MVFLPIIIPLQPNCFVLFCVVGWVMAIMSFHFELSNILVKCAIYANKIIKYLVIGKPLFLIIFIASTCLLAV